MSDWAIKMIACLTVLWVYCLYRMIKAPYNSPKERLYMGLAISCAILMIGCTYL